MMARDSIGLLVPPRRIVSGDAWRAVLLRAVDLAETWSARIAQRRQLACLDARMLRDIGRSEADVLRETAKPFWRA